MSKKSINECSGKGTKTVVVVKIKRFVSHEVVYANKKLVYQGAHRIPAFVYLSLTLSKR